jgi:uncharacterized protein (TIGR03435 family)
VGSEKFTIEAKAETPQTEAMMRGPMKQKLLEDRFQLRIRHQTRDGFLAVAKGGPKLKPPVNGKCRTKDEDPSSAQKLPRCGWFAQENDGIDTFGQTIAGLCDQFSAELDRDVIDQTGIAGEFDIYLAIPQEPPSTTPEERFATVAGTFRKLGLRLEAGNAPDDFVVIEHVERPSLN